MRADPARDQKKSRPSRRALILYYLGALPIALVAFTAYLISGDRGVLLLAGMIATAVYVAIALPILLWGNPRRRS